MPRFQQPYVVADDGVGLLREDESDLVPSRLQIQAVDVAQHAQNEHVLAALGIGDMLQALAFHGDFVDLVPVRHEFVTGPGVRSGDLRVLVGSPFVLQENDAAGLEFVIQDATQQHLLVEGDDQVGLVTPIGNAMGCQANAVAAGAGDAPRRWLNFCGDDLGGPNPVSHPRRDGPERLATPLRPLAGIADDLDDMLLQRHHRFGAG